MKLTNRQQRLFDFVKWYHASQLRKYTGDPYWTHLFSVADIASKYKIKFGTEISLCHDLLEDTECTYNQLVDFLFHLRYPAVDAVFIGNSVHELTDQYTHYKYPNMNREARKHAEAERLIGISANSQSVKYADIIDNTSSIVQYDPGFAAIYLPEIGKIIYRMNKGVPVLYARCVETYEKACESLKINPHVQSV